MDKNSINLTDARNDRDVVHISIYKYLSAYETLCNKDIIIEENVNKRGCVYLHTRRIIITFTMRNM